jgi:hypothetical protein
MNRFLVASAIVGSSMGVVHGYKARHRQIQQISLLEDVGCGVRDAVIGAVVYPFIIPIGVYQIATNAKGDACLFKSLTKKSSPSSETPLR